MHTPLSKYGATVCAEELLELKLAHTFAAAPSAVTALFALMNVASDVITFSRASWHANPVPHALSQL